MQEFIHDQLLPRWPFNQEADESDGDGEDYEEELDEADVEEEEEEVTWVDAVEADDKYALIEEV